MPGKKKTGVSATPRDIMHTRLAETSMYVLRNCCVSYLKRPAAEVATMERSDLVDILLDAFDKDKFTVAHLDKGRKGIKPQADPELENGMSDVDLNEELGADPDEVHKEVEKEKEREMGARARVKSGTDFDIDTNDIDLDDIDLDDNGNDDLGNDDLGNDDLGEDEPKEEPPKRSRKKKAEKPKDSGQLDEISASIDSIAKGVAQNQEALDKLQKTSTALLGLAMFTRTFVVQLTKITLRGKEKVFEKVVALAKKNVEKLQGGEE